MKFFFRAVLVVWSMLLTSAAFAQSANLPGVAVNFGQGTNLVDTMEVYILYSYRRSFIFHETSFGHAKYATQSDVDWVCDVSFTLRHDAYW